MAGDAEIIRQDSVYMGEDTLRRECLELSGYKLIKQLQADISEFREGSV